MHCRQQSISCLRWSYCSLALLCNIQTLQKHVRTAKFWSRCLRSSTCTLIQFTTTCHNLQIVCHRKDDVAESAVEHQLVVYNPPQFLKPLQEREKRLVFGGREWIIEQNWDSVGVAAVVWEPVSPPLYRKLFLLSTLYEHCSLYVGLVGVCVCTVYTCDHEWRCMQLCPNISHT